MIILEFKVKAKKPQFDAIDSAIRTGQFIQNKCLRLWMDSRGVGKYDLSKVCAELAKEFGFADELNSMARQASAERAWSAIARFYDNCKKQIPGKKGYPKFKHNSRSVEYKTSGWKLDESRRYITFTDGKNIGKLKLVGTRDLNFYQLKQIKRVRLVKRADGYYCQFCVAIDVALGARANPVSYWIRRGAKFLLYRFSRKSRVKPTLLQKGGKAAKEAATSSVQKV